jgi:hypothetical protein
VREREQPRPERAPAGIEALGRGPQLGEHGLAHLFGQMIVAQHAPGQSPHRAAVAAVDLGEGARVALRHGAGEDVVVRGPVVGRGAHLGRTP